MATYSKCHTYQVTKTINAPLKFVYDWCTDYREDDNQITGLRVQFKILQKTKQRVIYLRTRKQNQRTMIAVKIVTLHPPKAWQLDQTGEDALGTYRLMRLGPTNTTQRENYGKIQDQRSPEQRRG